MPRSNIWDRLEDDRNPPTPDRVGIAIGWRILAVFIAIAALSAAGWGISVLVSRPKGAGDVIRQNNSGNNRIASQQHFQSLWGDINGYIVKLDQAKKDVDAHPGDQWYQTNYTGLVNQCADAVAMYNADADKTLQAEWRNPNLPYHIDARATCMPGVTNPVPAS